MRGDPGNRNLRKNLEESSGAKHLKRVRVEPLQRFNEDFVSWLEIRINDGDQAEFYKNFKGVVPESRTSCRVQYIIR